MRANRLIVFVLFCGMLAGCSSTQRRSYNVGIVNASDEPVILWLTKDGPPTEGHWLTPSQWHELQADGSIPADAPSPAVQLPPGMKVDLGPQEGRFGRTSSAVLLVYSTPVTLEEMAATPRSTSLMDAVYLEPGQNYVMVRSTAPVRAQRVARLEGRPAGAGGRP